MTRPARTHCPVCDPDKRKPPTLIRWPTDRVYCHRGCDWRDVKDALDGAPVERTPDARPASGQLPPWPIAATWNATRPITERDVAGRYLLGRGCLLPPEGSDLRWHPGIRNARLNAAMPALVARISDPVTAEIRSLHFTFLENGDPPKRLERLYARGHHKAGVVRLWPDSEVTHAIGIAEGIETALSLAHAFTPVWAALDAGNLAGLPTVPGVECITIAADHDPAGVGAARACANRWSSAGREARVVIPKRPNSDLNDVIGGLRDAS